MVSIIGRVLQSLGFENSKDRELRERLDTIHQWPVEAVLTELKRYTLPQVQSVCAQDPWLANYLTNLWEYQNGVTELQSYPWNVCLPIVDVCNAACTFCNSWLRGKRWLKLEELENFTTLIKNAKLLGLAGHGEPLIHPEFEALSQRFSQLVDPRCSVYLITNGYLLNRYEKELEAMNVMTYNISLNAACPETHNVVMGLGPDAFERAINGIKKLIAKREAGAPILVNISLVVVKQNLPELVDFVKLGNELGVNNIYIRTLMASESYAIPGLNYHTLSPGDHTEFDALAQSAKDAIAASAVPVESDPKSWGVPLFKEKDREFLEKSPPKTYSRADAREAPEVTSFYDELYQQTQGSSSRGLKLPTTQSDLELYGNQNPFQREAPFQCSFVYYNLNLNDFEFKLSPCCYMDSVPGFERNDYDGQTDFFEAWNSPAFVELRRSLQSGPLFAPCKTCPTQGRAPKFWDSTRVANYQRLKIDKTQLKLHPVDSEEENPNLVPFWSLINKLDGKKAEHSADGFHVVSSPNTYDWLCHSPDLKVEKDGRYLFMVRLKMLSGQVSFGLFDEARTTWRCQSGEPQFMDESIIQFLEVELKAGAPVAMLIANENIARRTSEFVIEDCRVYFCSTVTDKV
ncbi:MAG: radical SAM/SPASM domain-containing protein [Planctomycetota bacterium]|nr:radical SAM/SPASM domain-containing protein [Planctomycetota bacterium]